MVHTRIVDIFGHYVTRGVSLGHDILIIPLVEPRHPASNFGDPAPKAIVGEDGDVTSIAPHANELPDCVPKQGIGDARISSDS